MIVPPRWSWLHWWEANRDRFLYVPSQAGPGQVADALRLQAMRDEAAAELIVIVQSTRHDRLAVEGAEIAASMT